MSTRSPRVLALPRALLTAMLAIGGCASGPGALRFRNEDPHWRVRDTTPIPRPRTQPTWKNLYYFESDYEKPITWALGVPEHTVARNVNALGEVPDSTWFTNRIGIHDVSVERLRAGPGGASGPELPLRIRKLHGMTSFMAEDARGDVYVVKLDTASLPELASGADVVSSRLLWAIGYNVPDDSIVYASRSDLLIDAAATMKVGGRKVAVRDATVDDMFRGQPRTPDGEYRLLASKFLAGVPVGPFATEGVRADDPNDRVPHEHRRELRGQYVFFGWLAHTDLHPGNRLDMWVEDRPGSRRGHLVHYLVDFDQSLGAMALDNHSQWDSYAHRVDYAYIAKSVLALGLWRRPWERASAPGLRGIGRFAGTDFAPEGYHPRDYYMPFLHKDDLDAFWAAKILVRLRPEHIRAAVEAARFSDPRSTDYLVEALLVRQRASARHWLGKVSPLDEFEVEGDGVRPRLCGVDLLVRHGLTDEVAEDVATVYDGAGRRLARRQRPSRGRDGTVCLDGLPQGRGGDGYLVVHLRTVRRHAGGSVFVHLARNPADGRLRVIGTDRRR